MINTINIEGRLTKEVDIKEINGNKILNNSIAVYGGKEETYFFDIKAFNFVADKIYRNATKGSKIVISGVLKQDKWEKDGTNYSKVVIYVDSVVVGVTEKPLGTTESQEESDMPY